MESNPKALSFQNAAIGLGYFGLTARKKSPTTHRGRGKNHSESYLTVTPIISSNWSLGIRSLAYLI